jgi:DNA-binding transcriptional MerR regulator
LLEKTKYSSLGNWPTRFIYLIFAFFCIDDLVETRSEDRHFSSVISKLSLHRNSYSHCSNLKQQTADLYYNKSITFVLHEVNHFFNKFFLGGFHMHTVKEAALMTGLTEHAVRFYTDKGLVPSVQRNINNIRLFDEESINWLYGIKCLKQTGMKIENIKTYVNLCLEGDSTVPQRFALMKEYKEMALVQLEEAQQRVAHLEETTHRYQAILENRIPDTTNPNKWGIDRKDARSGPVLRN